MVKQPNQKNRWEIIWAGMIVLGFVVLVLLFGVAFVRYLLPVGRWLLLAAVMVAFLILLGRGMSRRAEGILIDSRYKMSLSRFQMTLWTVLVLSAYFTIALPRPLPGGLPDIQTDEQVDACIKYLKSQDSEEAEDKAADIERSVDDQDFDETRKKAQQHCTPGQPLNITFPAELLVALGISTASLAGSSLIKTAKDHTEISPAKVGEANKAYQDAEDKLKKAVAKLKPAVQNLADEKKTENEAKIRDAEIDRDTALTEWKAAEEALHKAEKDREDVKKARRGGSSLAKNDSPDQATWGDMFRLEGVAKDAVDLAKVQMFFLTIVVVFAYGAAIYGLLTEGAALTNPLGVDFPAFSSSLNALLGLSHGGYLTAKHTGQT